MVENHTVQLEVLKHDISVELMFLSIPSRMMLNHKIFYCLEARSESTGIERSRHVVITGVTIM